MQIMSRFKDYYDAGMASFDDSIVYRRYPETVTLDRNKPWGFVFRAPDSINLSVLTHTIGFCGKVYACLEVGNSYRFGDKEYRASRSFCYNLHDLDVYIEQHYAPECVNAYRSNRTARKPTLIWTRDQYRRNFERFFNAVAEKQGQFAAMFEEKRSPIFVVRHEPSYTAIDRELTWNAQLKHFDFIKVFGAYQAFQEIAMWLGNQAEPRKPIPKLDDETMAEIKGFDPRFSFRKEKTKVLR